MRGCCGRAVEAASRQHRTSTVLSTVRYVVLIKRLLAESRDRLPAPGSRPRLALGQSSPIEPPATVSSLFEQHQLSAYAAAVMAAAPRAGTTSASYSITEAELQTLIVDVKMLSGHVARLRKALPHLTSPPAPAAAPVPPPPPPPPYGQAPPQAPQPPQQQQPLAALDPGVQGKRVESPSEDGHARRLPARQHGHDVQEPRPYCLTSVDPLLLMTSADDVEHLL